MTFGKCALQFSGPSTPLGVAGISLWGVSSLLLVVCLLQYLDVSLIAFLSVSGAEQQLIKPARPPCEWFLQGGGCGVVTCEFLDFFGPPCGPVLAAALASLALGSMLPQSVCRQSPTAASSPPNLDSPIKWCNHPIEWHTNPSRNASLFVAQAVLRCRRFQWSARPGTCNGARWPGWWIKAF